MQVEQHLGEVPCLALVALHTFHIARLAGTRDRLKGLAGAQGLLEPGEPLVTGRAFGRELASPVVLPGEGGVPIGVARLAEQPERGERIQEGPEIELVDVERPSDCVRVQALAVEEAKDLQPLGRDDHAGDDEGLLDVDLRQRALGELVESRPAHRSTF